MTKVVKPNFSNKELSKNISIYFRKDMQLEKPDFSNNAPIKEPTDMSYNSKGPVMPNLENKPTKKQYDYRFKDHTPKSKTGALKSGSIVSSIYSFIQNSVKPKFKRAADVVEGKIQSLLEKLGFGNDEPRKDIEPSLVDYSEEVTDPSEEGTTEPNEVEIHHDHGGGEPVTEPTTETTTEPTTTEPTTKETTTEPTTKETTTKETTTKPSNLSTPAKTPGMYLQGRNASNGYGPAYLEKVKAIAEKHGLDYKRLLALFASESGINAHSYDGTYAGIMQMNADSCRNVGTTPYALSQMDPIDQLDYIDKHITNCEKIAKINNVNDLYALNFLPYRVNNPYLTAKGDHDYKDKNGNWRSYYDDNSGLDYNHDGKITKEELGSRLDNKYVDESCFSAN